MAKTKKQEGESSRGRKKATTTTSKSGQSTTKAKATTTPMNKNATKKLKTVDQQVEDVNLPSSSTQLEDLPAEMLVNILKQVDSRDLFSCRRINMQWHSISSTILQSRDDSFVVEFDLYYDENGEEKEKAKNYIQKSHLYSTTKRSLEEFLECYKNSTLFPYTRFKFRSHPSINFNTADIICFFSDMGSVVKSLTLDSNFTPALIPFLRKLLLEQTLDLKELKFVDCDKDGYAQNFSTMSLFPENDDNDGSAAPKVVLPRLLRLTVGTRYNEYLKLSQDIIEAASNLQLVNGPWDKEIKSRDIQFWFSIPKKLVTNQIGINPTIALINYWKKSVDGKTHELPSTKKIRISASNVYYERFSPAQAATFINMFTELYKDQMTSLELEPLGFIPGVNWSNFGGIRQLCLINFIRRWIREGEREDFEAAFFPSNINKLNVFPMVEEIDFKLATPKVNFPTMGYMPKIPNARYAKIDGNSPKICIEKVVQMCPNLTKVDLNFHGELLFSGVAKILFKRMKKLKELSITIDLHYNRHKFPALDSGFTGYSGELCEALWDKMQEEDGHATVLAEINRIPRTNPSILDLKDLKKLSIKISNNRFQNPEVTSQLEKAVTDVSKIFAFDLCPNLEVSIKRRER